MVNPKAFGPGQIVTVAEQPGRQQEWMDFLTRAVPGKHPDSTDIS
jgi:hypothetical protein